MPSTQAKLDELSYRLQNQIRENGLSRDDVVTLIQQNGGQGYKMM